MLKRRKAELNKQHSTFAVLKDKAVQAKAKRDELGAL
jgi:hypothetical protein